MTTLGTHRGDVYNGADDNASGVAALLEIAEAFALAAQNGKKPRRTILVFSRPMQRRSAPMVRCIMWKIP